MSTTGDGGEAAGAGARPPEPGFAAVAGAILHRPTLVGESVARLPLDGRMGAALALIVAVALASGALTMPYVQQVFRERLAEQSDDRFPAERREEFLQRIESPLGKALILGTQGAATLFAVPLIAFLLYIGQAVMGGRATFAMVLSVTAFACLISFGMGTIVKTALVLARGSIRDVSTGLGVLVRDRPLRDPLRAALDAIDVFSLWAAVAAGLALAPPARLTRGTTLFVSLGVYFAFMSFAVGLRSLGH